MIRRLMLLAAVACSACTGGAEKVRPAEFTVEWLGSDTGGLNARPEVSWCPSDTSLRLFATKAEDGVGLLILPLKDSFPGTYTVIDPLYDSTRVRPGVAVGSRWVDKKTVAAYQSDSGSLTISQEPTGLAGKFMVRLHGVNTTDTVRMTGHFGGVTPAACPAVPPPPKPPGK